VVLAILVLTSAPSFVCGQVDNSADSKNNVLVAETLDVADKAFSEAKTLIASSNWPAAAEKLNLILTEYPHSKYYEPSLYWLAYVRRQQGNYREAILLVNKFIREFPNSTWNSDARVLRLELAAQVRNLAIIDEELRNTNNEEVKLAALNSLLQLEPERGLRHALDIINSKTETGSRNFREGVVKLIGRYGGDEASTVLLDLAQTENEQEVIRTAAIFALRQHINENVLSRLTELVMKGDSPAVVEAVFFVFLQREDQWAKAQLVKIASTAQLTDTRRRAIYFLSKLKSGAAIDEIMSLYETGNVEVKREILSTLSKTGNPVAQARVFEISRLAEDRGIREEGFLSLGSYGNVQIISRIIQLYDDETRDEVKLVLLSSLSKSKLKNAHEKLTDIAQNEKSLDLRTRAAQLLRRRP